ncbi:uncharacterized protein LOC117099850 [Anneissia japonica]|uniref:uncharacterized protein LOC117099850 n=1 Tax=Anneissia japonica TaxID=1529436 RepID=UPI001425AE2B|nr:uncharacterized protein LOC117099850 [Anneissia japonica]
MAGYYESRTMQLENEIKAFERVIERTQNKSVAMEKQLEMTEHRLRTANELAKYRETLLDESTAEISRLKKQIPTVMRITKELLDVKDKNNLLTAQVRSLLGELHSSRKNSKTDVRQIRYHVDQLRNILQPKGFDFPDCKTGNVFVDSDVDVDCIDGSNDPFFPAMEEEKEEDDGFLTQCKNFVHEFDSVIV